jgi:pimeloyl-ACP methyl ester carboxylesterase
MRDNHYLPRTLPQIGKGTRAHWAREPADKLIIFVHGFGGSSTGTWPVFPQLLPTISSIKHVDFIFYGYDGLWHAANNSAVDFFRFLAGFLDDPANTINPTLPARETPRQAFEYDRILLVAHSLGAIICRRALLRAHRRRYEHSDVLRWLDRVRLLLFAPAHCGAYVAAIASAFLTRRSWFLIPWGDYTRYKSPLLTELMPESGLIEKLLKDTDIAFSSLPPGASSSYLIATRVIWAGDELVVVNEDFYKDPLADKFDDKNHFQVCKPSSEQDEILLSVVDEL